MPAALHCQGKRSLSQANLSSENPQYIQLVCFSVSRVTEFLPSRFLEQIPSMSGAVARVRSSRPGVFFPLVTAAVVFGALVLLISGTGSLQP